MGSTLVILACIAVLVVAAYLAYNPQEQARQKRDKLVQDSAKEIVDSVSDFYKKYSCYPWEYTDSECKKSTEKFDQVPVSTLQGLSSGIVKADFLPNLYLTYSDDSTRICFAPESKSFKAMANKQKDGQTYCKNSCFACVSK